MGAWAAMPQSMHGISRSANTFKEGIWNRALQPFCRAVQLMAQRPELAYLLALESMADSIVAPKLRSREQLGGTL